MSDILIDTSVLIDYTRGRILAAQYLSHLFVTGDVLAHSVVAAELLAGVRDRKEQNWLESLLINFQILTPDDDDWHQAIELLKRFRLSHGIKWPDALIAATCLRLDLRLATLDAKHFSIIPSLRLLRPY